MYIRNQIVLIDNDHKIDVEKKWIHCYNILLTSAAIKAKVLKDMKKKAAAMQNKSMKEDSTRIAANNPRSRA